MFVLRKIFGNGVENNFILGKSYQLILADYNSLEFESAARVEFGDEFNDECYGFVIGDDITRPYPLWKVQKNYIMSDNGNTFANLTYRQ